MPIFEQAGRSWTLYLTDNSAREIMMIEVRNSDDLELVMEVVQHEDGGPMTVSMFEPALPFELVEAALADARNRLLASAPA